MHWEMAGTIIKSENSEDQILCPFGEWLGISECPRMLPASTCVLSSVPAAEVCEKIIG